MAQANIKSSTTLDSDEERRAKFALAFSNLETPLFEARNMAGIAAILLEEAVGNLDDQRRVTGKPDTFFIPEQTLDQILFAVSHVATMIKDINNEWHKVADGESVS